MERQSNKHSHRFSTGTGSRAVRMVYECEKDYSSRWAALQSVAGKIGCTAETLRSRLAKQEKSSSPAGKVSADPERIKALEREVKELRRANEILKKVRRIRKPLRMVFPTEPFFAQAEPDRPFRK